MSAAIIALALSISAAPVSYRDLVDLRPVIEAREVIEPVLVEPESVTESAENVSAAQFWQTCTITHYCPCSQCCGQWAGGLTSSGTVPTAGRTVACGDLPAGTRILINGEEYTVEDTGVSGAWIDIFVNSHEEALAAGMYQADVYLVTE